MEKYQDSQSSLPVYQGKYGSSKKPDMYRRPRRTFTLAVVICLIFLIITYAPTFLLSNRHVKLDHQAAKPHTSISPSNTTNPVSLEAHIMSKCPDARDCLRDLVVPAMEKVVDKVDFRISYIGKVDANHTIKCMHGSTECLGNMLGLCASELYPNAKISLGFTMCLINDYKRIPDRELVENCALEHAVSFTDLNACISEEGKGLDLLEASVHRSEDAGVKKSCTVRVAGKEFCVRDGGKWKDCAAGHEPRNLIEEINGLYIPGEETR